MAEKCFDVNGVEIKKGDVVEPVETDLFGPCCAKTGDLLYVDIVEPSNVNEGATFVRNEREGRCGHGKWRIVQRLEHDFRNTEAPTKHETPSAKSPTIPDSAWSPGKSIAQRIAARREHEERIARDLSHDRRRTDPTNPKDAIGSHKAPCMPVPTTIQAEDGLAMFEGALKYGRHNYRVAPVRASVYLDAARRHMNRWIEGEDIDPDSGLSHLTKARACLGIIRDAQICGTLIDDRPPSAPIGFFEECDKKAAALVAKYPNPVPPYVAGDERIHGHPSDVTIAPCTTIVVERDPIEVELDALKARTTPR